MKQNRNNSVDKIRKKFNNLNSDIKKLGDKQFHELMKTKTFDKFLLSILNPKTSNKYSNLQEFFLDNKYRLTLLAGLRNAINQNYSFKGNVNGSPVFVSPLPYQWLSNGVIFLQGKNRFEGLIGFYDSNKDIYFAKSKRNFKAGDKIDLINDLFFDFVYQKVENDEDLNPKQKEEVIDKLEEIKQEKDIQKRKQKFEGIKKIVGQAWYLTNKAFWDSVWESLKK